MRYSEQRRVEYSRSEAQTLSCVSNFRYVPGYLAHILAQQHINMSRVCCGFLYLPFPFTFPLR